MSYAEAILKEDLPPAKAYWKIIGAMNVRRFPGVKPGSPGFDKSLALLSPGERALVLTADFNFQVHTDGFHDYFGNTNCRHAQETVRDLEMFGLSQAADLLRRALAAARVPDPLPDQYEYNHTEHEPPALAQICREFYQAQPTSALCAAAVEYVRWHPEQFI
jgi:hypothetical protein